MSINNVKKSAKSAKSAKPAVKNTPEPGQTFLREMTLLNSFSSFGVDELIAKLKEIKKDIPKDLHEYIRIDLEQEYEPFDDDPHPVLKVSYRTYL